MKNLIWIFGLLLFVVYSTRLDVSIKKAFSLVLTAELDANNLSDEESAEEERGESKDDGSDEKTFIAENVYLLLNSFLDFHKMAVCHMIPSPSFDIESPPPKI